MEKAWECLRQVYREPIHGRIGGEFFPGRAESLTFAGALALQLAVEFTNSTFANLPGHRKMETRSSQRLKFIRWARGLADGDRVRVFRIGLAGADGTAESQPACGVVAAHLDWGKLHFHFWTYFRPNSPSYCG